MYPFSYLDQIIYPSTLDIYGLIMLYEGNFGQTVHLPSTIPYKMLAEVNSFFNPDLVPFYLLFPSENVYPYLSIKPQAILYQPMILLVPSLLWMAIALIFGLLFRSGKKATLVSIIVSVFVAYSIAIFDIDLVSLGRKIVPIIPAIMIGASIGGFIGRKITGKTMEITNLELE